MTKKNHVKSAGFWDRIAEKYAAQPIKDVPAYEKTMEITRARLKPIDKVLELGAGTGSTALLLAGDVSHYTASDISENMTSIGRRKAEDAGVDNISFIAASTDDERLSSGAPYDAVLAFNLLHLIEDAEHTMQRVADLLKPGGFFISKTVCLGDKKGILGLMIPVLQFFGKAPFVQYFKSTDVDQLITNAGFEILETGAYPPPRSHLIVSRKR
ncbi:MAG: class I SAM-dependent methyltransferase [Pseudomonadota bacterium]